MRCFETGIGDAKTTYSRFETRKSLEIGVIGGRPPIASSLPVTQHLPRCRNATHKLICNFGRNILGEAVDGP